MLELLEREAVAVQGAPVQVLEGVMVLGAEGPWPESFAVVVEDFLREGCLQPRRRRGKREPAMVLEQWEEGHGHAKVERQAQVGMCRGGPLRRGRPPIQG